MGYRQSLLSGLGWIGFFRISAKALVFLKIIIAYRVLSPREVGLYGLCLIALGLLEMLTETGVNVIIVKESKPLSYYLDTAFIVSVGRGLLITLILFFASFLLPSFFNDSGLFPLMLLLSLIPTIRGFINPAVAKFQKDLAFSKDALLKLSTIVTDVGFSVLFVFLFPSAISLISGMIISAFGEVLISFIFIRPWPKWKYNGEVFHAIVSPGKWVNLAGLITYAEQNFDNVVVGRILGSTALGYYQTAFNLTRSLITEVGLTFSQVLLPIFGKIGEEKARLMRAVLRVFLPAVSIMMLPAIFLNIPYIQKLLLLSLGEKWAPMTPLLPYLSIAALFAGMNTLCNPLYFVKNSYRSLVFMYGSNLLIMIIAIVYMIPYFGLVGAARGVLLARILMQPFFVWRTLKLLNEEKKII